MTPTETYKTLMERFKKPNKQSMSRSESQQQVIPRVAPTLTADDIEKEKTGSNGEVVKLADQKPAQTSQPTQPTQPQQPEQPEQPQQAREQVSPVAKPTMPGTSVKQPSKYAVMQQSNDLAERVHGMDGIMRYLNSVYPQQDQADLEKKAKRDRVLAAIGDGMSAFHEAYAKSRGMEPITTPGKSMTQKAEERRLMMEKLNRETAEKRNNALLKWAALKRQQSNDRSAWLMRQQQAEQLAKSNEYKAKYHAALEENFKTKAELEKQKIAEREREFNEKQAAAKEKADKDRQSRERTADKNRAAANARAAKAEAGRNARHAKSEANKDKRAANSGNKNKPAGGNTGGKKHKQNPYG